MAPRNSQRRPPRGGQARADQTRARVINETVQCVMEEGIHAASAKHIAERAGVTWGVIQYHFGSRDGLLTAVVDTAVAQLVEALRDLPHRVDALPVDERIDHTISAVWQVFSTPTSMATLEILIATRAVRDSVAANHLAELEATFDMLGDRIGEGIDTHRAATLGNVIRSALRGILAAQLLVPVPIDTSAERSSLVHVIGCCVGREQEPSG